MSSASVVRRHSITCTLLREGVLMPDANVRLPTDFKFVNGGRNADGELRTMAPSLA